MKTTRIHAVQMVRRIRDAQAKSLARKSVNEVVDFFRTAGDAALKDARAQSRPRRRRAG